MAAYPKYQPQFGIYNPNNFSRQPTANDGLTIDTAKLYFLQFPNAQTSQTEYLHSIGVGSDATFNGPVTFNETVTYNQDIEFLANVIVDGTATVTGNLLCESTATITDILTCETGIDISVSGGVTFPDNTTQTTAFIEANYAQLNTDNIFEAGFTQTFNGDVNLNGVTNIGNNISGNYSQINQTGNPNVLNIYNASPYSSTQSNYIAIQLNNSLNNKIDALKIYQDSIVSNIGINLQGTNGISLNGGSITNMGSLSSGYTQPNGTGDTTIATTAFVQNMFIFQNVTVASPVNYIVINPALNGFQSLYQVLDNDQYIVTFNQTPGTGTAVGFSTTSSVPPNTSNIQLNFQSGYVVPWTNSAGKNMGLSLILNTATNTYIMGSSRVFPTYILISLPYNTFLLNSTTYTVNFEFFNVGV